VGEGAKSARDISRRRSHGSDLAIGEFGVVFVTRQMFGAGATKAVANGGVGFFYQSAHRLLTIASGQCRGETEPG